MVKQLMHFHAIVHEDKAYYIGRDFAERLAKS